MVLRVPRCEGCRQKKIKCDQAWPVCGPCKRSKKRCSVAPVNRIRFVDKHWTSTSPDAAQQASKQAPADEHRTLMIPVESRNTAAGSFQKLRIFDRRPQVPPPTAQACHQQYAIERSVPATPTMGMAAELAYALKSDYVDGVSCFAPLFSHVPAMLDHSEALAAATACCLDSRSNMTSVTDYWRVCDFRLFGKALKTLQDAVHSVEPKAKVATAYAISILLKIETTLPGTDSARRKIHPISVPLVQTSWIAHASGLCAIFESIGPFEASENELFDLLRDNFGPMVSYAFGRGEESFLSGPQWLSILRRRHTSSSIDRLFLNVLAELALLPTAILPVSALHKATGNSDHTTALVDVCRIRHRLHQMDSTIKRLLNDQSEVTIAPCTCSGSPVDSIFVFHTGVELCRAIAYHDLLAIIMNQALVSVTLESASRLQLEEEIAALSTRIWMMHEQARHMRSLGFFFYMAVLLVTYESATERATQDWIVALMNELQGGVRENGNNYWTRDMALTRSRAASGRGPMI